MKCLRKFVWVKIPRAEIPHNSKGMMLYFLRLASRAAFRKAGIEPMDVAIRGGTDGAKLSFMGLPCPNLPTGGGNYHSRDEYVSVDSMERCVDLVLEIVKG